MEYFSIFDRSVESGIPSISAALDLLFLFFSKANFMEEISTSDNVCSKGLLPITEIKSPKDCLVLK